MLHPASAKRSRVSNPPIPSWAPGVLRPPVARLRSCLRTTHRRIRRPLRTFSGLRGPTSGYGRSCSASSLATRGNPYVKWAEPKYGASPRPDTCPVLLGRHLRTGPRSGFMLMTFPFRIQSGRASLSSMTLRRRHAELGALEGPKRKIPEKSTS